LDYAFLFQTFTHQLSFFNTQILLVMTEKQNNIAKTRREIAAEFGISYDTLMRKLKKCNIQLPSGLVYQSDQRKIYNLLNQRNNKSNMEINKE